MRKANALQTQRVGCVAWKRQTPAGFVKTPADVHLSYVP